MLKQTIYSIILIIAFINTQVATATNKEQPIKIQSNHAEFNDASGTALYTGKVTLDQGDRHLKADSLKIIRDQNRIHYLIATGSPAIFNLLDKNNNNGKCTATTIKYFLLEDKIELIGNAEIIKNNDTIKGNHMTYFIEKELLTTQQSSPNQRTTVILNNTGDS